LSLFTNLTHFWEVLSGFGAPLWLLLVLVGLAALATRRRWQGAAWLLIGSLPLLAVLVVGRTVFPRYYGAGLGVMVVLAGAGLGLSLESVPHGRFRKGAGLALGLLLAVSGLPFMVTLHTDPAGLTLPASMREQYYTGPSAGFGLSAAARALPELVERRDLLVIGSMRPDSCYQANFYAPADLKLICTDAPGVERINAALDEQGAVYVLTDHTPLIGVDVATLDAQATRLADFPRPGEALGEASVVLWLLERQ
jgi:hypothetical protein